MDWPGIMKAEMGWPPIAPPWPITADELIVVQEELGRATPPPWPVPAEVGRVAACFVCFERGRSGPGAAGDRGWAVACLAAPPREPVMRVLAGAPYEPGRLALREGPLLEAALHALPLAPDLLVVNATGRDHPQRAGLALHLGARLGVPSIGVTNRPLLATGESPEHLRGATRPLKIADDVVAFRVRTRARYPPARGSSRLADRSRAGCRAAPATDSALAHATSAAARSPGRAPSAGGRVGDASRHPGRRQAASPAD